MTTGTWLRTQATSSMKWIQTNAAAAKKWIQTHQRESIGAGAGLVILLAVVTGVSVSRSHTHGKHAGSRSVAHSAAPEVRAHKSSSTSAPAPRVVLASATVPTEARPNAASAEYMKAGYTFFGKKDYPEAANAFREAAKQDDKNADARWWLAKSYALHGDEQKKACKAYGAYLEIAPSGNHAREARGAMKKCSS